MASTAAAAGGGDGADLLEVVGICDNQTVPGRCSCVTQYAPAELAPTLRRNFEQSCVDEGGTIVQACTAENEIGECEQGGASMMLTHWLYRQGESCTGGEADWSAWCAQAGGVWR